MKMVQQLLDVKKYREQKAEKILLESRTLVEQAAQRVIEAERKLKEYQDFLVAEEERMYSSLYKKVLKVRAIEDVRDSFATLKGRELQFEENIQKLEQEKKKAEVVLETSKKNYHLATQATLKYKEFLKIIADAEAAAAEKNDENEVDELFSMKYQPNSWADDEN